MPTYKKHELRYVSYCVEFSDNLVLTDVLLVIGLLLLLLDHRPNSVRLVELRVERQTLALVVG